MLLTYALWGSLLIQHTSPIDPAGILEIVGGDSSALAEIVAIFCDSYPPQIAAMRTAIAAHNGPSLRDVAHSLKGGVSHFDAVRAHHMALALEQIGKNGDFSSAPPILHDLEQELARVREAVLALLPPSR